MDAERWAKTIAVNVWVCRKAAGFTQQALADVLGWKKPAVTRLESGRHLPSLRTLLDVAEALEVSPVRLLKEVPPGESIPVKSRGKK